MSTSTQVSAINRALIGMRRRADQADPALLQRTYVDIGSLSAVLASRDHQVIFGRRGTGKTHALQFHAEAARATGDIALYIDMRTLGSTAGLYEDSTTPLAARATRLLVDLVNGIQDELVDLALSRNDLAAALPLLDELAAQTASVIVEGQVQEEVFQEIATKEDASVRGSVKLAGGIGVQGGYTKGKGSRSSEQTVTTGVAGYRLVLGGIRTVFQKILKSFAPGHVWLLLDEWSAVPLDLQPLLADFIRRGLLPLRGISVKICAIEQRSRLSTVDENHGLIGIELGADAAADVNLDDFLMFGHDAQSTFEFYRALVFAHLRDALAHEPPETSLGASVRLPKSAGRFVRDAFTQEMVFREVIHAAQGVPRDAINVLVLAAQSAGAEKINVRNVRLAAQNWYERDKESAVRGYPEAEELWRRIYALVVHERRASAFAVSQRIGDHHPVLLWLYDQRVIHLLRRGVLATERPEDRYDIFGVDYGCYAHRERRPDRLFQYREFGFLRDALILRDSYNSLEPTILPFLEKWK